MYGPVGDVMSPDFIEQLQASRKQFEFNALKEKYKKPEGSAEYDFSGDREQLAQNMKDLGFVDNNPMTMEAMTSKYSGFLDDLYGVPPISGQIVDIPGGPGGETAPDRNPDGSPIVGHPEMFDNPPNYYESGPAINPNAPPADPNTPSLNPDAPGYVAETPVVEQPKYTPNFLSYDELKDKDRGDIIDYYRMLAGFKSGGQVKGVGSLFRKK